MASMQVSLTTASPCRHALNIQPSKELFICCRAPFRSLMSTFLRHTSPALPVPPPRPTHASSSCTLLPRVCKSWLPHMAAVRVCRGGGTLKFRLCWIDFD